MQSKNSYQDVRLKRKHKLDEEKEGVKESLESDEIFESMIKITRKPNIQMWNLT
jgi:hypothetical protein